MPINPSYRTFFSHSWHMEEPAEWQRRVDWISSLAMNLMAAANDLRLVQVICASDQKKELVST